MPECKRAHFDFSDKTVLVTGATSGLGAAIAEAFASSGADVALAGRDPQRGAQLRERLRALGRSVEFIPGDITDRAYCDSLVSEAVSALGRLNIVVNSAGVAYHATVDETTDEQWQNTFDVNVSGTFYVCRAAIPAMREHGGVIVNIASDAALTGSKHLVAYCASKGAVLQMTRAMALDHARDGIRVIAVCPGDVDTPMLRGEFRDLGLSAEEGLRQSAEAVPLNRVCTPEEVADLVLFSASDSGRFVTGYPLVMDGGSRA
jgi:meso-butanediol dehydrogenase/(S,S)-butanediol dehydrogenase/diacetyl reductase